MIDQDQSDNVTSMYLLNGNGQTAQNTTANIANLTGATTLANGSDDVLLTNFIDPTIGCTPMEAPDLANNGTMTTSQALNEIQANANEPTPAALVPENDEMTLVNNAFSATKTNLYRSNLGQTPISAANNAADGPANYCQNMVNIQTPFLAANQTVLATGTSPVPAIGNNLFTFLANRLNMSFTNLNCQNFGLTNPVTVTLDGNGAAVAATFNTAQQTATTTTAAGTGTPGTKMEPPGAAVRAWWQRSGHRPPAHHGPVRHVTPARQSGNAQGAVASRNDWRPPHLSIPRELQSRGAH